MHPYGVTVGIFIFSIVIVYRPVAYGASGFFFRDRDYFYAGAAGDADAPEAVSCAKPKRVAKRAPPSGGVDDITGSGSINRHLSWSSFRGNA